VLIEQYIDMENISAGLRAFHFPVLLNSLAYSDIGTQSATTFTRTVRLRYKNRRVVLY
jgi:hypothetical protein